MPDFVYQIPDLWIFFIINSIMLLVSFVSVLLIEKFIPAQLRYKDNQPIGYISSSVCLIFAVLAGFASLYVLNNFTKAKEVVQKEADMAMAIYKNAGWLDDPLRSNLQNKIKNYLITVIDHDWALMTQGKELDKTTGLMIGDMTREIHQSSSGTNPPFALQEVSKEVIVLGNAREERRHLKRSALGPNIWIVLILTAVLTVAVNYTFGMQFYLHFITVAIIAITVSSTLFLLITLDHPFQGIDAIGTEAFQHYLDVIYIESARDKLVQ